MDGLALLGVIGSVGHVFLVLVSFEWIIYTRNEDV
jgi:hypothetical protein